jgi:hypothetical protein
MTRVAFQQIRRTFAERTLAIAAALVLGVLAFASWAMIVPRSAAAAPVLEILEFNSGFTNAGGGTDTQAGSHPYEFNTSFAFPQTSGSLKVGLLRQLEGKSFVER